MPNATFLLVVLISVSACKAFTLQKRALYHHFVQNLTRPCFMDMSYVCINISKSLFWLAILLIYSFRMLMYRVQQCQQCTHRAHIWFYLKTCFATTHFFLFSFFRSDITFLFFSVLFEARSYSFFFRSVPAMTLYRRILQTKSKQNSVSKIS